MIAYIKGEILEAEDGRLIVTLGGLGLEVRVPVPTWTRWAQGRGELALFTYLSVKENELALYGFETREELTLFRLLLEVSGVGPKLALGILSCLRPQELRSALAHGDLAALTRSPGVGRRLAERILLELKGKIEAPASAPSLSPASEQREELVAALTALGYSQNEAQEAIRGLPSQELSLEEQLKLALSYFAGER